MPAESRRYDIFLTCWFGRRSNRFFDLCTCFTYIGRMKRLKMTDARKRLFQLADEVAESREEVVLTRRGKKDVVLVNEEEWICVKEKGYEIPVEDQIEQVNGR